MISSFYLLGLSLFATPAPASAPSTETPTIAVLYFDYSGNDETLMVLKKGLAQMLISDLSVLDGVRIVERDRLEAVYAEQKLTSTGKVDKAMAAKLGKLLGARYLILGGYFDLVGALRADARVVDVETGRVLHSVGSTGTAGEFMGLEEKLSAELSKALATVVKIGVASGRSAPSAPKTLKTKTAVRYSQALDATDRGDKPRAKRELEAVVKEEPEFRLAANDLKKLMQ